MGPRPHPSPGHILAFVLVATILATPPLGQLDHDAGGHLLGGSLRAPPGIRPPLPGRPLPNARALAQSIPVGQTPDGAALDPATRSLYVGNYGSSNISVIDTTTARVIESINFSGSPWAVGYDPKAGSVVVAGGAVGIINTSTNTVAGYVSSGIDAWSVAIDTLTGTAYLASANRSAVYAVDVLDRTLLATIPVGAGPLGISYDPLNRYVYVADQLSHSLSVINTTKNQVVDNISLPSNPEAVVADERSGDVYVTLGGSGNVSVVDGLSNAVVGYIPAAGGGWGEAIDYPDGWLVVSNPTANNLTISSLGSRRVMVVEPAASTPSAVVIDGAGRSIFVAEEGSNEVRAFDLPPPTEYPVDFHESGLPNATNWSVGVNGTWNRSLSASVGFSWPNGTGYAYSVAAVTGYIATPASGTFSVVGLPQSVDIAFAPVPPVPGRPELRLWVNQTSYGGDFSECRNPGGSITSSGSDWTVWLFSAVAWNGTAPYNFTWTIPGQPATFHGARVSVNTTDPPGVAGVVGLTVIDAAGNSNTTSRGVPIPVIPAVRIPPCPSTSAVSWVDGYALAGFIALGGFALAGTALFMRRRSGRRGPGR